MGLEKPNLARCRAFQIHTKEMAKCGANFYSHCLTYHGNSDHEYDEG